MSEGILTRCKVNLLMMVFMFPETRYNRRVGGTSETASSTGVDSTLADKETGTTSTKIEAGEEKLASRPIRSQRGSIESALPVGRPSKRQFSLIPTPYWEGSQVLFRDFVAPIQIFTFPIVSWAAFTLGFSANCLLSLNLTQSQLFAEPPYNFNPAQVGFVNFSFAVGAIVALLTAGPVSDWVSIRATRRNNGVREAEMRLIALIPYIAICLIGMVVSSSAALIGFRRRS